MSNGSQALDDALDLLMTRQRTPTKTDDDPIYEQLAERNAELESEKARLLDENERLRLDNEEIRKQLTSMRCP